MAFATLPGLTLSWTQIVPTVGETFVQYNIYRDVQDADHRIAVITNVATVTYTTYNNLGSGTNHEYFLTWYASVGGDVLESAAATITDSVTFSSIFIHDVTDGTKYGEFPGVSANVQVVQAEQSFLRARGRTTPTLFITGAEANVITLSMVIQSQSDRTVWNELVTLIGRQRTPGNTMCLRWGHAAGETYFVQFDGDIARADATMFYTPQLKLREVYYDESV